MIQWIFAYLGAALAMLVLDGAWLSFAAKRLYRPELGNILLDGFRMAPAAAFYFLYVGGIVFIAVAPGLAADKWTVALTRGMALGLIAYATYDLTNQATLKQWSTTVTLADMAWGTVLTGVAASAGFFAARWAAAHV
ncbi:MAG: DUF2177 family protein [Pseudomonadota bacterium]|nr:DUF2177 family protein [Pseudomonadota bacterium]